METKIYTMEWKVRGEKTCDVDYIINEMSDDPETLGADLSTESDVSKVSVGDIVVIWSRGKYRTAIVNNVGRKNIKAGYATVGGIEDARKRLAWQNEDPSHMNYGRKLVQDGGDMHATVTNKSTDYFYALKQTETETETGVIARRTGDLAETVEIEMKMEDGSVTNLKMTCDDAHRLFEALGELAC
jgi:hypothetical protein|tara:strand:+ start:510 stop:1067 length:558 start_codon:yes stop_codon:yes gene_type:complete